jgi:hypothetical protein
MRIELTPRAKERLESVCTRLGLTQVAATSRIIESFAEQSDVIQAFILRLFPLTIVVNVARMMLKRLAGSNGEVVMSPAPARAVVVKPRAAQPRSIMRIQLHTSAKEAMEQYCEDAGMTQVSMMSALTTWFVDQDKSVQAAVLGQYGPDITTALNGLIARKVAAEQ